MKRSLTGAALCLGIGVGASSAQVHTVPPNYRPPEIPAGSPAVIPIFSPAVARPAERAASAQTSSSSIVSGGSSLSRAWTPQ